MGDARHRHAAHPFVEMGQNRAIFHDIRECPEEFRDGEAERDDFVHLAVVAVGRRCP